MTDQSNSAGELSGVAEASVTVPETPAEVVDKPVETPVETPVVETVEAPAVEDHTSWLVNAEQGLRNVLRLVLSRDREAASAELDALNTSLKG